MAMVGLMAGIWSQLDGFFIDAYVEVAIRWSLASLPPFVFGAVKSNPKQ